MTRTLLVLLGLAGLTAAAPAQTLVRPVYPPPAHSAWGRPDVGTYNYNNPLYHGVYPPTAFYPGGYASSQAYTNPGSAVPTTYITHYGRLPAVPVIETHYTEVRRVYYPPPVVETHYTEIRSVYYPPPVYPAYRGRWR